MHESYGWNLPIQLNTTRIFRVKITKLPAQSNTCASYGWKIPVQTRQSNITCILRVKITRPVKNTDENYPPNHNILREKLKPLPVQSNTHVSSGETVQSNACASYIWKWILTVQSVRWIACRDEVEIRDRSPIPTKAIYVHLSGQRHSSPVWSSSRCRVLQSRIICMI